MTYAEKSIAAEAYKQKMEFYGQAGDAAEQGFMAGIDYAQQNLQQADCSMLREQLVQMLKRKKRRYADKRVKPYEQSKAFWNIAPLEKVIKLIDELQPVA